MVATSSFLPTKTKIPLRQSHIRVYNPFHKRTISLSSRRNHPSRILIAQHRCSRSNKAVFSQISPLNDSARTDKHPISQRGIIYHRPEPHKTAPPDSTRPMNNTAVRQRSPLTNRHPRPAKGMNNNTILNITLSPDSNRPNLPAAIAFIRPDNRAGTNINPRPDMNITNNQSRRINISQRIHTRPVASRITPKISRSINHIILTP